MNPEMITLKSSLEAIVAFQDELASLYEQAAKEGADRAHFQSFRQLESLNAQYATELRELLQSHSEALAVPLSQQPQVPRPAAQQQPAGESERSLMAKALSTEKTLQDACAALLQTAPLPTSVQPLLERQIQASRQACSLLENFL